MEMALRMPTAIAAPSAAGSMPDYRGYKADLGALQDDLPQIVPGGLYDEALTKIYRAVHYAAADGGIAGEAYRAARVISPPTFNILWVMVQDEDSLYRTA